MRIFTLKVKAIINMLLHVSHQIHGQLHNKNTPTAFEESPLVINIYIQAFLIIQTCISNDTCLICILARVRYS